MIYPDDDLQKQLSDVVWEMLTKKELHSDVWNETNILYQQPLFVMASIHSIEEAPEMEFPF